MAQGRDDAMQALSERLLAIRRLVDDCLTDLAAAEEEEDQDEERPCKHPRDMRQLVAMGSRDFFCSACGELVRRPGGNACIELSERKGGS